MPGHPVRWPSLQTHHPLPQGTGCRERKKVLRNTSGENIICAFNLRSKVVQGSSKKLETGFHQNYRYRILYLLNKYLIDILIYL